MQEMECRDALAVSRAEHALAVAEIEEARGVVQHSRSTGEQVERVAKQTVAEAHIRCEVLEHEAAQHSAAASSLVQHEVMVAQRQIRQNVRGQTAPIT